MNVFRGHKFGVYSVAFSRDEHRLVTGGGDDITKLWEIQSGKLMRSFREKNSDGTIDRVSFSPGARELFSTSLAEGTHAIWDVDTGRMRDLPQLYVGFSSDGQLEFRLR